MTFDGSRVCGARLQNINIRSLNLSLQALFSARGNVVWRMRASTNSSPPHVVGLDVTRLVLVSAWCTASQIRVSWVTSFVLGHKELKPNNSCSEHWKYLDLGDHVLICNAFDKFYLLHCTVMRWGTQIISAENEFSDHQVTQLFPSQLLHDGKLLIGDITNIWW